MRPVLGAAAVLLALAGCGSSTPPAPSSPTSSPASRADVQTIPEFDLYTHCGVREARIGTVYYAASPVLDDGHGNPPPGWGNPGQVGSMTVRPDGTAHFSASGGLQADFRIRPGATTWAQLCS
jgi:hypothetical protein